MATRDGDADDRVLGAVATEGRPSRFRWLATSCYPGWVVDPAGVAPSLRGMLDATLAALPGQLRAPGRPGQGSAACRVIAEVYDRVLAERFVAADGNAPLALVATGGDPNDLITALTGDTDRQALLARLSAAVEPPGLTGG
jgi:hypothetical protein